MEGENWKSLALKNVKGDEEFTHTPIYVLDPVDFTTKLEVCLIHDDPRLPEVKLNINLNKIIININDARLIQLLSIVKSIPLPSSGQEEQQPSQVRLWQLSNTTKKQ